MQNILPNHIIICERQSHKCRRLQCRAWPQRRRVDCRCTWVSLVSGDGHDARSGVKSLNLLLQHFLLSLGWTISTLYSYMQQFGYLCTLELEIAQSFNSKSRQLLGGFVPPHMGFALGPHRRFPPQTPTIFSPWKIFLATPLVGLARSDPWELRCMKFGIKKLVHWLPQEENRMHSSDVSTLTAQSSQKSLLSHILCSFKERHLRIYG